MSALIIMAFIVGFGLAGFLSGLWLLAPKDLKQFFKQVMLDGVESSGQAFIGGEKSE